MKLYLKEIRQEAGLKQVEVANMVGITRQAYSAYEKGIRKPDPNMLRKLADALHTTVDYIVRGIADRPECLPIPETVRVPRVGTISCGKPILAVENHESYDEVPTSIHCDFTVLAKGDSMIGARIYDGDIVYIRQQDTCEHGDIAAVLIDNEVVLKRFIVSHGTVMLMSENPKYLPIIVHPDENIRILGKAVGFVSRL